MSILLLLFIFVLASFLGFELIQRVPSQMHTPLMSGTNAISGITLVGALVATGIEGTFGTVLCHRRIFRHHQRGGLHRHRHDARHVQGGTRRLGQERRRGDRLSRDACR